MLIQNQIPNQIIKVTLLKSDNIYATGSLTIKNGEQWVTFNYEHKKKTSTNLALSLIDCIKIKFMCRIDYIIPNKDKENEIKILSNTEIPNKTDNNLLIKPSPKKLYSNLTSNKKKSNYINNKEENMGDPLDSLHNEESKISKIFENMSPELKYNEGNNALNNTTLPSNKKSRKNPLIKSDNLSEFNPLAASSGVVGKDFKLKENKNKNIKKSFNNNNINQKRKTSNKLNDNNKEKENKKQKSNNNISLNNNENDDNNKQKSGLKRNRSKNNIDNKIKPNKKEKQTKSNTNNFLQGSKNSNLNHSSKKLNKDNSLKNLISKNEIERDEINNNTQNNFNNSNVLINKISNEIHEYSKKNKEENKYNEEKNDNYIDEINDFGFDNFTKKLEDFHLLYSDDYIKNIKQEDYSLEMELYIEKLIELISEYHLQIEEKDIEYQLLKNTYKKNINLFSEQNKLFKKLQLIIDDYKIKDENKKSIINYHVINRLNNTITNKNEINIFNYIYFSQKEKETKDNKEKLKKILKNILNKPKYKSIINQNEKIKKWININLDKSETIKEKGKKRITTGKSQKSQQDDKDKGKYNKTKKNINNSNSSQAKAKNKLNKK